MGKRQTNADLAEMLSDLSTVRSARWYFWEFVHNAMVHPLLSLPWEPRWAQRAHDWTAKRCWGGG
jgi:hypothetical protein